ncbi:Tetratricopeptide repeat-containing protein [Solimonas aquatica]|uniref:Tetratricopeptide repeat-containing protein n=1 Tax=Solimonas aquatica TaxID=489703 RepID=A0A1H9DQM1_9GAMM|nr:tetratricopeptide repeat protein [Solimonas aquatica]SEQ15795.1 Tetratricopeptide repeat-containing protein [Solimonas aquatica]
MRLPVLALVLGSCLLLPGGGALAAATQRSPEQLEREAEAQFHVVAGEMAAGRKQPALAAQEFLQALEIVDSADLARRATALAIQGGDQDLALQAARRWLAIEPTAMDPREVIAQVSLLNNDSEETQAQAKAIIEGHAGGVDDAFKLVASILGRGGASNASTALQVMQNLVAQYPKSVSAAHAMALLALRFGQLDLADQASKQALLLAPKSKDEKLLRVGVLVKQQQITQADALVEEMSRQDAQSDDLRLAYAKLLLESTQREPARAQLKKILEHSPKNQDAQFALAVMAISDHDYAYAEKTLKPMLDGERGQDAALQLGRAAELQNQPQAALDYYDRATSGTQGFEAAVRKASLLAQLGRIDEARALLRDLRARYPQLSARFTIAEGELLVNSNRSDEALQVFNEGIDDNPENLDLLYGRSLVYERLDKITEAEKDLRAVIAADPDNVRSLNALGYMLAVHTKRYDEAQKLIAQALKLDPDDAAIMDSMGWVEYKRGNARQARDFLQRAFASFPDPEVAAHLGEVLWSLGSKDQAREIWNQALRGSPDHPVLKETMQRLQR